MGDDKKKKSFYQSIQDTLFSSAHDEQYLGSVQKHFEDRIKNLKLLLELRSEERETLNQRFLFSVAVLLMRLQVYFMKLVLGYVSGKYFMTSESLEELTLIRLASLSLKNY